MGPKLVRDFYLLSLNPKTGYYINVGSEFSYGILGSILMELYRQGKISFQSKLLVVVNPTKTNYPFMDKTIELIQKKGQISVANILAKMAFRFSFYKKEVVRLLLENRDITKFRKTFIGIGYNRYYPSDRDLRTSIIRRIRDILLRNEKPTAEELMLLSLIHVCQLYRALSDVRLERKLMRNNMKQLIKNGAGNYQNFSQIFELQKGLHRAITSANATTTVVS